MELQVQYQNKRWPKDCWETFAETRFDTNAKMIANYLLSIGIGKVKITKTVMEKGIIVVKPTSKPIKFKGAESP